MSEVSLPSSESQPVAAPSSLSAGALLRQAREASGLHVAALAVSMKVPVKKLEALESDRLDLLPDAVFVRALACSVCRALKIDPAPVLLRLPQSTVPRLNSDKRSINAPFHLGGHASQFSMPAFLARPVVWVVAILLVGAAVLMAFPESQPQPPQKESDVSLNNPGSPAVASQTVVVAEPAEVKALPTVVDAHVTPTPAPTQNEAAPAPVVAASAPSVNLAGGANGMVAFKASGASWVEVTDAKGVVQLRKTLVNGEAAAASGVLPLAVVIGRADVTQVEVRGKPFALADFAKDNVARFEVK